MLLRNIKVNYFRKEKNKRKELIKEEFVGISRCQLHITASIHCGGELYRKLFTSLLQAGLVVLAKLCSIFVELTQVQCLHYCHETCRKEQVCAPSVQSQDLLVVVGSETWLWNSKGATALSSFKVTSDTLNVVRTF